MGLADPTLPVVPRDRIAFVAGQGPGVYTIGSHGTRRKLFLRQGTNPDWSPDGRKIAVGSDTITVFDMRGKQSAHIWGPYDQPACSPDGRKLAYIGPDENHFTEVASLWVRDLGNGKTRQVATHVDENGNHPGRRTGSSSPSPSIELFESSISHLAAFGFSGAGGLRRGVRRET